MTMLEILYIGVNLQARK